MRLLPCDVLARVAPLGQEVARFEVELAQRLAETGGPVALLEPRFEPRAYERDGFVVALWTYYAPVPPSNVEPADFARALARLHAGMRTLDVTTPHFTDRVAEAEQLVASRDQTPALADPDCCRGPIEFDLAHVPEEVALHYPGVNRELLGGCRHLVLAMVAAWRCDAADQFPNGRRVGQELVSTLRRGPPWPSLDVMMRRLAGP